MKFKKLTAVLLSVGLLLSYSVSHISADGSKKVAARSTRILHAAISLELESKLPPEDRIKFIPGWAKYLEDNLQCLKHMVEENPHSFSCNECKVSNCKRHYPWRIIFPQTAVIGHYLRGAESPLVFKRRIDEIITVLKDIVIQQQLKKCCTPRWGEYLHEMPERRKSIPLKQDLLALA